MVRSKLFYLTAFPPPAKQHHMDPSSNFCNYRTALQGAAQRSQTANSNREKIVIPVFNLFIKDIYFLHKIHTNRLPNGQINFKVGLCYYGNCNAC